MRSIGKAIMVLSHFLALASMSLAPVLLAGVHGYQHPFPRQNPGDLLLVEIDRILRYILEYPFDSESLRQAFAAMKNDFVTDFRKCELFYEGYIPGIPSDIPCNWWVNALPGTPRLTLRTEEPLLDATTITLLRQVASDSW